MKTVYKYPLQIADEQKITMPIGAEILCVQVQFDTPCLWVKVDTDASSDTKRTIQIHGTGHLIKHADVLDYIGSFQLGEGALVFHVFERSLS